MINLHRWQTIEQNKNILLHKTEQSWPGSRIWRWTNVPINYGVRPINYGVGPITSGVKTRMNLIEFILLNINFNYADVVHKNDSLVFKMPGN